MHWIVGVCTLHLRQPIRFFERICFVNWMRQFEANFSNVFLIVTSG
jgi:hypothetical protein